MVGAEQPVDHRRLVLLDAADLRERPRAASPLMRARGVLEAQRSISMPFMRMMRTRVNASSSSLLIGLPHELAPGESLLANRRPLGGVNGE